LRRSQGSTITSDHLSALVEAVRARPLRRPELAEVDALRGARPNQLERLITQAVDGGLIIDDGGVLRAAPAPEEASADQDRSAQDRGLRPVRVVAIDFESVVRTTAEHPYTERRAFQVGALRFGRDWDWVFERRSMSRFCELPDVGEGPAWQITSPTVAARHVAEAVSADVWLGELDDLLTEVLLSACDDSPTWGLLADLAGMAMPGRRPSAIVA
jgi:hypothetical protein